MVWTHFKTNSESFSAGVYRLAVLLTLSVFPLIWVGGLVTTYGAGMAVPDWPNTYGWNMFLYPPSTWLYGGFDLMVEHGHRLLGSLAGLISIGLLIAATAWDRRRWFRWWCLLVLLAVIGQGLLGGLRVRLDERTFAMIHACTGQLFLIFATATAVFSSRWWAIHGKGIQGRASTVAKQEKQPAGLGLARTTSALLILAYCQVIAGAQLRHVTGSTSPGGFMGLVHIHLTLAGLVLLLGLVVVILSAKSSLIGGVRLPARLILLVILLQISLGLGTWLVNYAIPWQEMSERLANYVIQSKGYWESIIVTAHVATGALLLSLTTVLTLRAWRSRSLFAGPA
jgi:cytochrome c oxidase assembly protein subunit 15